MEIVKLELEVPKEITEVGQCIGEILKVTGKQLADGWKTGDDLPPILVACFSNLLKAIEGIQDIPSEFLTAPFRAELGLQVPIQLGAEEMVNSLKKK